MTDDGPPTRKSIGDASGTIRSAVDRIAKLKSKGSTKKAKKAARARRERRKAKPTKEPGSAARDESPKRSRSKRAGIGSRGKNNPLVSDIQVLAGGAGAKTSEFKPIRKAAPGQRIGLRVVGGESIREKAVDQVTIEGEAGEYFGTRPGKARTQSFELPEDVEPGDVVTVEVFGEELRIPIGEYTEVVSNRDRTRDRRGGGSVQKQTKQNDNKSPMTKIQSSAASRKAAAKANLERFATGGFTESDDKPERSREEVIRGGLRESLRSVAPSTPSEFAEEKRRAVKLFQRDIITRSQLEAVSDERKTIEQLDLTKANPEQQGPGVAGIEPPDPVEVTGMTMQQDTDEVMSDTVDEYDWTEYL